MKILVINGPNLNMLGIREKELYGDKTYSSLVKKIKSYAKEKKVKVKCYQSNFEGAIVTKIQKALDKFDRQIESIKWMDNGEELVFSQQDDKLLVNFTGFSYGQSLCVRVAQVKFK